MTQHATTAVAELDAGQLDERVSDVDVNDLRRQMHRLTRDVGRLDPGSRLQLANDVDAYLERIAESSTAQTDQQHPEEGTPWD